MSKKKKIIITVAVLLFISILIIRVSSFLQTSMNQEEPGQNYIPVNAETVQKGTIATTIALTGKVEPVQQIFVMPKTPGIVQSLSVQVGDKVNKDQVLLTLDKTDIQSSYSQTSAALKAAEANYQAAKEQYDKALSDLAKYEKLYEAEVITEAELEQARLMASDTTLLAAQAQVEQAQASLQAVQNTLNDMNIKSTIDGIVTDLTLEVGDMATNASPAVTVVNMDQVYVSVSVTENVINRIKIGQEVSVEIPAAKEDNLKGKIDDLSLAADPLTGKYSMKIFIDNPDHILKSGMFAQVKLDTDAKSDVVVVSTDAIVYHNGEYVAYVVKEQKAVEKVVTTGLDNGDQIEVVSGLTPGEILIVVGQNYVSEGSIVKVIEMDGVLVAEDTQEEGAN